MRDLVELKRVIYSNLHHIYSNSGIFGNTKVCLVCPCSCIKPPAQIPYFGKGYTTVSQNLEWPSIQAQVSILLVVHEQSSRQNILKIHISARLKSTMYDVHRRVTQGNDGRVRRLSSGTTFECFEWI
ncbi:hypothetical protein BT63DRAFT_86994 [Microthyrium microscopicum]|uniref:Uncharacterized protein n=1 Tax=Microthyrium microscopicum TaxID=703497 RepID=A0A6A6U0Q6_9PEZI|nr:hypothetical protein BT63DRAFT_86994 [Microthyrium microscopicum]